MVLCLEAKSDVSTHPDYVPSIFGQPQKKVMHAKRCLERHERAEMNTKRRCPAASNEKEHEEPSLDFYHKESTDEDGSASVNPPEQLLACTSEAGTQTDLLATKIMVDSSMQTDLLATKIMVDSSTQTDPVVDTPVPSKLETAEVSIQVDESSQPQTLESTCISCSVQTDKITEALLFSDPSIRNDDEKVLFYTGLPNYATLLLVLEFITSGITASRGALTTFQELFLVLMKLRLNLEEKDLAYRFGIHQSTVSRIFKKWIALMARQLAPLIRWPTTDEVRTTMPMAFRKFFSKCICIIDCTEVFIDWPSDLKVRAQTWSNYKQHNTVKFLIAVTPQGTISFVSKAWGGYFILQFLNYTMLKWKSESLWNMTEE